MFVQKFWTDVSVISSDRVEVPREFSSYLWGGSQFFNEDEKMILISTGTWHHREWVLNHMPKADWKRELLLCNTFLEYDERNCKHSLS